MKIANVRLGLATNSSSTHYIVFFKPSVDNLYCDNDCEEQQYNWNEFTCATTSRKMEYLSHVLYRSIVTDVGEQYAKTIVNSWVGSDVYNDSGYIDHNSTMTLPSVYSGKGIDIEFFNDFKEYLSKDNVLIIGGNDNSDPLHDAHFDESAELSSLSSLSSENLVCRKDGSVWFLFNRKTGARFSLSFDDTIEDFNPQVPLLVDLKITDFCLSGCDFCYQNSTPAGKHASGENVKLITRALEKLKVFEIAIGGGEPSEFPEFNNLIYESYSPNVIKNFSTRNEKVARDFVLSKSALSKIPKGNLTKLGQHRLSFRETHRGACALTIDSATQAQVFANQPGLAKSKFVFHYVMGSTSEKTFKEILQTCRVFKIPIILLGFKNFGRGVKFEPKNYDNWIQIVRETEGTVGIDTALAASYEEQLKSNDISELTYSTKETDTSMYIDAVQMTMKSSSYSDAETAVKLSTKQAYWSDKAIEDIASQIAKAFLKFRQASLESKYKHVKLNEIKASTIMRGNRPSWELRYNSTEGEE